IKPEEDASKAPKEWEAYEKLCQYGANAIIARVSVEIMEKILEFDHPHEMWKYLRAEYYRDTAFALVSSIRAFTDLPNSYDPSTPISEFVSSFETEWLRLRKLCGASKDSYRVAFSKFLDEDKAKRDFLLGFLVRHHKNVVDNLSTKDNLSFADVKQ